MHMETQELVTLPEACPACAGELEITELVCTKCGTELNGRFAVGRLVNLPEPYASVLEMFLKVRGNVKEMESKLGLSYPTGRARLEEAFDAAGLGRNIGSSAAMRKAGRMDVLRQLNLGQITAAEAADRLRKLSERR